MASDTAPIAATPTHLTTAAAIAPRTLAAALVAAATREHCPEAAAVTVVSLMALAILMAVVVEVVAAGIKKHINRN